MLLVEGLSVYLTADVIKRCKEAGICTVLDFLSVDAERLSQKISTPYKDVSCIQRVLLACYSSFAQSGESLYEEQLQLLSIISTGCNRLNEFLDGGIYTGEITEIHGVAGAGKTQLCLSILASLVSETESSAMYLDTCSNFSGRRFEQIVKKKLQDDQRTEDKMKMLHLCNVYDIYDLFQTLHCIKDRLCKQDDVFYTSLKLIVLDSVTPLIAPCLGGEKQFHGQGLTNAVAQQLKLLCCEHSLSIVVCNNMVQGDNSSAKPALGRYWAFVPSVTLCISKKQNNIRSVCITKSCRRGTFGDVILKITDSGMSDVD